jgi:hypothetical protein
MFYRNQTKEAINEAFTFYYYIVDAAVATLYSQSVL